MQVLLVGHGLHHPQILAGSRDRANGVTLRDQGVQVIAQIGVDAHEGHDLLGSAAPRERGLPVDGRSGLAKIVNHWFTL